MNKWIAEFELEDGDTMPEHMDLEYKGARIDFHCKLLEQEPTTKNDSPKYCDRSICLKNEYNNVGCEDCEVTKSQESTTKNDLGVDATQMIDKSNFSQEQYKSDLQSAYDCGYAQANEYEKRLTEQGAFRGRAEDTQAIVIKAQYYLTFTGEKDGNNN